MSNGVAWRGDGRLAVPSSVAADAERARLEAVAEGRGAAEVAEVNVYGDAWEHSAEVRHVLAESTKLRSLDTDPVWSREATYGRHGVGALGEESSAGAPVTGAPLQGRQLDGNPQREPGPEWQPTVVCSLKCNKAPGHEGAHAVAVSTASEKRQARARALALSTGPRPEPPATHAPAGPPRCASMLDQISTCDLVAGHAGEHTATCDEGGFNVRHTWGTPPSWAASAPTPIALAHAAVRRAEAFRLSYESDGVTPARMGDEALPQGAVQRSDAAAYERALTAEQRSIKLLADCQAAEMRGVAAFMETSAWGEVLRVVREELASVDETGATMKRIGERLDAVRVEAERRR